MALKGLGDDISKVRMIHTEVEHFEIYEDQPLFRDIKHYLNKCGFLLAGFTSFEHYAADAVFVNRATASNWQKLMLQVKDITYYKFNRMRLLKDAVFAR